MFTLQADMSHIYQQFHLVGQSSQPTKQILIANQQGYIGHGSGDSTTLHKVDDPKSGLGEGRC